MHNFRNKSTIIIIAIYICKTTTYACSYLHNYVGINYTETLLSGHQPLLSEFLTDCSIGVTNICSIRVLFTGNDPEIHQRSWVACLISRWIFRGCGSRIWSGLGMIECQHVQSRFSMLLLECLGNAMENFDNLGS